MSVYELKIQIKFFTLLEDLKWYRNIVKMLINFCMVFIRTQCIFSLSKIISTFESTPLLIQTLDVSLVPVSYCYPQGPQLSLELLTQDFRARRHWLWENQEHSCPVMYLLRFHVSLWLNFSSGPFWLTDMTDTAILHLHWGRKYMEASHKYYLISFCSHSNLES